MNILSLFDGISCGRVALERAGIKIYKYYASEIDKYAIQVSQKNYPDIIQIGDVTKVDVSQLDKIDLLIGGSPCQGFSFAGKQLNFEDPRSKLFFEYVRILKELKERNPNIKFLLENVKMKKEYQDVISKELGVEPIEINSYLVSAQSRIRLYWTNIENIKQPENKKIYLKHIIETGFYNGEKTEDKIITIKQEQQVKVRKHKVDVEKLKKTLISNKKISIKEISEKLNINKTKVEHWFRKDNCFAIPDENIWFKLKDLLSINTDEFDKSIMEFEIRAGKFDMSKRVYKINGKSPTLTTITGGHQKKIIDDNQQIRSLTVVECERLQTLPDNYTQGISDSQRYKCLGNGWTVDVIAHIFKQLNKYMELTKEQIYKANRFNFMAAIVWHLNNPDTTTNIPNAVYITLEQKLLRIPEDRILNESEMMAIVKQK